ncbi:MAG: bifunctional proline dehydrogenase/L-glutamate gamma-semialdehyde dehydrogenase, partial [Acidimicrobiia bacterium]|nr:bifunctional proline dehydrogenase/L-glutamate gamma-semialdehyde dehydrogenase [Acidimicrobiia bacterium]
MSTSTPNPTERPSGTDVAQERSSRQLLVEEAVALVREWLDRADELETRQERVRAEQLGGVIDPRSNGVEFAMRFVDRVVRPEDNKVAAHQLHTLVQDMASEGMPAFLSPVDRILLRVGGRLAPLLPGVVMPLAVQRMRQIVGPLVVDADPGKMAAHLGARRDEGFRLNVNQLGEAVLGEGEAQRRWDKADALLDDPNVHYVSVKTSSIVSQLNYWAWDDSVDRVLERLRPLFLKAAAKGTFMNLDMEEYHDLELTIEAFCRLLDEPELSHVDAGIVLQAYLPDSFPALQNLVQWAGRRRAADPESGVIKIRLVKGANLAMERVEAAMHDWPQAPYHTKAEVDANYKRCLDWVLTPERTEAVRIGLASHNLFDVAWGYLLAQHRGVGQRLELEMLQGMAMPQARAAQETAGDLLLYTPIVAASEFDVAISYLFRRLEENASDANFIRHLFTDLRGGGTGGATGRGAGSEAFDSEAAKFLASVADRESVPIGPNRKQDRRSAVTPTPAEPPPFVNEPDTDAALPANREWAAQVIAAEFTPVRTSLSTDTEEVDRVVAAVRGGAGKWAQRPGSERQAVLLAVADELSRRRGDLINAMVHEGKKTFAQA